MQCAPGSGTSESLAGITQDDLNRAVASEYRENEIFPKSDAVEDWLMLLDQVRCMLALIDYRGRSGSRSAD